MKDPIAFDWGADGRLWVVEMGDYPLGVDGKGKPGGVVRFLEDTDGDGRYDRATTFLDGLAFPTGVMPWRNGVLVACAPDIFYAEDRDGDGKADHREVLFTGFSEGNQQHRVNGFELGPRRLGLRGQRRQRRQGPLAQDGQDREHPAAATSGSGPTPASSRPRAARPSTAGTATTGATGSATTTRTGPGTTSWPSRDLRRNPHFAAARPAADARARHAALPRQPDPRPVQRPRARPTT